MFKLCQADIFPAIKTKIKDFVLNFVKMIL